MNLHFQAQFQTPQSLTGIQNVNLSKINENNVKLPIITPRRKTFSTTQNQINYCQCNLITFLQEQKQTNSNKNIYACNYQEQREYLKTHQTTDLLQFSSQSLTFKSKQQNKVYSMRLEEETKASEQNIISLQDFTDVTENLQQKQKEETKARKLKELEEIQNFVSRDKLTRKSVIQTPTFTKFIDEEGNSVINQYQIIKKLGRGAFGKVKLAQNIKNKLYYAIKICDKCQLKCKLFGRGNPNYKQLQKEIAIMKSLDHPNIIKLYEVIDDPEKQKLYLVMEFAEKGALFSKTFWDQEKNESNKLPLDKCRKYFQQLILGIDKLHNHANIVHRDIKPGNLLITQDDELKICDFGVSKILDNNQKIRDGSGTKLFLAPEVWKDNIECDGKMLDIWAAGVTLYYMVLGQYPFFSRDVVELQRLVTQCKIKFPACLPPDLDILLKQMLQKDPMQRINTQEILKNQWVTNCGKDYLENKFDKPFEISEYQINTAISSKLMSTIFLITKAKRRLTMTRQKIQEKNILSKNNFLVVEVDECKK